MLAVYLSPVAKFKLEHIISYLEQEWSEIEKQRFIAKFTENVHLIRHFPNICPESIDMPGIFRCVVSSQTSFYYRMTGDSIEIITVTDNRQDPAAILSELKQYLSAK